MRKPSRLLPFLAITALAACTGHEVREERYPDGSPESRAAFARNADGTRIPSGPQWTWYPDGAKRSLEFFSGGYRQGYAFRWYPNGRLRSVERYVDGQPDGQSRFWGEDGSPIACSLSGGDPCPRKDDGGRAASRIASHP